MSNPEMMVFDLAPPELENFKPEEGKHRKEMEKLVRQLLKSPKNIGLLKG